MNFEVRFYGTAWARAIAVPRQINEKLYLASTPEEVEEIISEHEPELAQLLDPDAEFLVCDSAAELMDDVLRSKGIKCEVKCGINDYGDSHSYVIVAGVRYDPTHQGYGDALNSRRDLSLQTPKIL